jgi:tRNA threonylcarbamoyl adenosine modification protein YeaZ
MTALILDTSGQEALLFTSKEGVITLSKRIAEPRSLSKRLLPSIEDLWQPWDYIAVGIGPGSFTGTRVGGIIAKTLTYALKIPLLTFSSPDLEKPEVLALSLYEAFLRNEFPQEFELVYLSKTP